MTGVDRPTRARSGGPWFTRPVAWILAAGVTLGIGRRRRSSRAARPVPQPATPAGHGARRPRRRRRPTRHARASAGRAGDSRRSTPPSARSSKAASPTSRPWPPSRTRRRRVGSSWLAPTPRAAGCRPRASGSKPRSPRRPPATPRSSSGSCCATWAGATRPSSCGRRSSPTAPTSARRCRSIREGARSAGARSAASRERRVPGGGRRGAGRSAHCHGLGRAVPREAQRQGSRRDVRDRAAGRPALAAGARRLTRRRWPTTIRRRRAPASTRRWRSIRPASRRTCGSPSRRSTAAASTDAGAEIAKVLAVNPDQVEALSLQAAIAAIEDRTADVEQLAQRVLTLRPGSGAVYRIIGAQLAGHYRFEEAVAQGRKAMALEPADPRTQAALGMHLLRTGDETAARTALDTAFRKRPVRRRHLQLAVDARHARPLRDDHHRGRADPEDPSRRKWR